MGKAQNEQWLKTRTTKVSNLLETCEKSPDIGAHRIDVTDLDPRETAKRLLEYRVAKMIRRTKKT
jgi:hypothetical protein